MPHVAIATIQHCDDTHYRARWFNGADPSGRQKPMEFDAGYANIECPIAFKIASDRAI
jgi:hypothetical protein